MQVKLLKLGTLGFVYTNVGISHISWLYAYT